MRKILITGLLLNTFLLLLSCKSNSLFKELDKSDSDRSVEVIKFMGTVNDYPIDIYEKKFWQYKEEHAKLLIGNSGFLDDVKSLTSNESEYFKNYNYAFIVVKGKEIDTLYSDFTLQSWILKKNKKNIYFYDKEGEIAKNLRHTYSFFRDCW